MRFGGFTGYNPRMLKRVVVFLLMLTSLCAVSPAFADEHCDAHIAGHSAPAKPVMAKEIPTGTLKAPEIVRADHSPTCLFLPKMPAKHCNMGDCWLNGGDNAKSATPAGSTGQTFADSVTSQFQADLTASGVYSPSQESAENISTAPELRPPLPSSSLNS